MTGARFSPEDTRDYPASMAMEVAGEALPERWEAWIPPVENQGKAGNCVAQALAAILEAIDHRDSLPHRDRSVGYLYFADADPAPGMVVRDALQILRRDGDVYRDLWERLEDGDYYAERRGLGPEITARAKRVLMFVRLSTEDEAKRFMMKYKLPVLAAGEITDFINPFAGSGSHAVALCGWEPSAEAARLGHKGPLHYLNSWGIGNWPCQDGTGWTSFELLKEVWGIVPMETKIFKDVDGARWSAQAIQDAAADGIIVGFEDGTFRPTDALTREQMAAIYQRIKVQVAKQISDANPTLG